MTSAALPRVRRDKQFLIGLAMVALLAFLALAAPWLAPDDPQFVRLRARLLPPLSPEHLLGTDHLGRDIAARLLAGLRLSVATAGMATLIAFTIGTGLGLAAASGPRLFTRLITQITSLAQSFPVFVLAVSIVAIAGNGFWAVVLTLGFVSWPVFCRVVLAEASSLMTRDHVLAARMMQMGHLRLLAHHVLPGLVPSLAVLIAFHFADMLIAESALSFLGIGAPLGSATWGAMLSESRAYLLNAPWMLLLPASAVVLVVIAFNLTGDGLRRRLQ
jgi:peptide/nickel transport system permease protein